MFTFFDEDDGPGDHNCNRPHTHRDTSLQAQARQKHPRKVCWSVLRLWSRAASTTGPSNVINGKSGATLLGVNTRYAIP